MVVDLESQAVLYLKLRINCPKAIFHFWNLMFDLPRMKLILTDCDRLWETLHLMRKIMTNCDILQHTVTDYRLWPSVADCDNLWQLVTHCDGLWQMSNLLPVERNPSSVVCWCKPACTIHPVRDLSRANFVGRSPVERSSYERASGPTWNPETGLRPDWRPDMIQVQGIWI